MSRHWILLGLGILLEVAGALCMKASGGLERPGPTALMFLLYGCSLATLSLAMRGIDLSIAYALWAAVGTMAVTTVAIVWFGEPATGARIFWLVVVVAGVIGLKTA